VTENAAFESRANRVLGHHGPAHLLHGLSPGSMSFWERYPTGRGWR